MIICSTDHSVSVFSAQDGSKLETLHSDEEEAAVVLDLQRLTADQYAYLTPQSLMLVSLGDYQATRRQIPLNVSV